MVTRLTAPKRVKPIFEPWFSRSVVNKLTVVVSVLLSVTAVAEQKWVEC